jgi:hemoglobin
MKGTSLFRAPKGRAILSVLAVASLVGIFVAGVSLSPIKAGEKGQKSLYERLGGVGPLAVVVDDFIDRLYPNPILNANPAIDAARTSVHPSVLKFLVTQFVCQATGGPCSYQGRPMKESHVHLNISEVEWQAMMADFRESLYKFNVPKGEQQELIALLESTKGDIVVAAKK